VNVPRFGGISASVAGMNPLAVSRFFKERFTKMGREARIERELTEQANKGEVDTEVLVKELERRNIQYRSPILTIGDYRHATIVDGVPKPLRNLVVRDYDLDEHGKVRPFIQELLRNERIQQIDIDTERDAVFTVPINAFPLNAKRGTVKAESEREGGKQKI